MVSFWGKHSKETKQRISIKMKRYATRHWANIDTSKLFIICKFCGNKKFFPIEDRFKVKTQIFCSKKCQTNWVASIRRGKPGKIRFPNGMPDYVKRRISDGRQRKFNHITKEWLIENYINKRLGASKCANLANCSHAAVYRRLKKFNILVRNYSESQKGLDRGGKIIRNCYICNKEIIRKRWKNLTKCVCSKKCLSELHKKFNSGKNCYRWKGGITLEQKLLRSRGDNKNWRRSVFIRDEFTCQKCKAKNIYIQAHHIKSWKDYPDLRFNINNGMTLCKNCHKEIHRREYAHF